jgi:hypothetical protein
MKQVDLLGSQVAAWDLGEDVAIKEAGKDETLGLGVPVKVRALKHERRPSSEMEDAWSLVRVMNIRKYETLPYNVHTSTVK